jgi:hypothetical protein
MNELELLSRCREIEPVDAALIDAAIEAIFDCPDHPARVGPRSSGPRRRRSRLALVGASVAAAVAAAGITISGVGGSPSPHPTSPVSPPPEDTLTAAVVQRSLAALATTNGYVEHVVQHDPGSLMLSWRGPNQLLDEFPGQSTTLWTWTPPGVDTVLSIDYQHHTWSKTEFPAPAPPPAPSAGPPAPGAYLFSAKAVNGPEPSATSIATLFHQPGVEVIGSSTIDGTPTYQLMIPSRKANGEVDGGKSLTAWVDARTYLPVRIAMGLPVGRGPGSDAHAAAPAWQDFSWEPATPQALAVFDVKPPTGFHQAAAPASFAPTHH